MEAAFPRSDSKSILRPKAGGGDSRKRKHDGPRDDWFAWNSGNKGASRKMGSAVWVGNKVEIECLVKCNRKLLRGRNRVTYPLVFGTVSKAFPTHSLWSESSLVKQASLGLLSQPARSDH